MGEFIVVLFIALVVVTLVGHGLWVFLAWLFRTLVDAPTPSRETGDQSKRKCVFCGRLTSIHEERCEWCGRNRAGARAQRIEKVKAAQEGLEFLLAERVIEPEEFRGLSTRLSNYRQQQIAETAAAEAKPAVPPAKPQADEVVMAEIVPSPAAPPLPVAPVPVAPVVKPVEVQPRPQPRPVAPPPPLPPPPPRKSIGEMIAEFMEPHNIRWGEIIGGLLFIVGAAALVITQWETLQRYQYLRFGTFLGFSAAVFGVGLYSHYRWKLKATSRGLLTIACLLVPLNFLAMTGLAVNVNAGEPSAVTLLVEAVALGMFAWLVSMAGKVLVPGGRWMHVVGLMGVSAVVLLFARRFNPNTQPLLLSLAGCLPVALFSAGSGSYLYLTAGRRRLSAPGADGVFFLAGTSLFALVVALGLLAFRSQQVAGLPVTLNHLAISALLTGVMCGSIGLTVFRRIRDRAAWEGYRVAGLWVALVGGLVMLAALGMAWPRPELLLILGLIAAVALAAGAMAFSVSVLHAGAIAAALVAYVSGYALVSGGLAEPTGPALLRLAIGAKCGTTLIGLFVVLLGISEALARFRRPLDSLAYTIGAGAVAAISLAIVTATGVASPDRAALVYGFYAVGGLLMNIRLRRPMVSYAGLALLVATTGWAIAWHAPQFDPRWAGVFSMEAFFLGLAGALLTFLVPSHSTRPASNGIWKQTSLSECFRLPAIHVAQFLSGAALFLAVVVAWMRHAQIDHDAWLPVATVCLTALYALLAGLHRKREVAWLASLVAMAGLVHALVFNYHGALQQPWQMALLAHATLAGSVALALRLVRPRQAADDWLMRVYVEPLGQSTLLSSALALVAMFVLPWQPTWAAAGCLLWLSVIWLAVAWVHEWPVVFAAHQAALAASVVVAVIAFYGRSFHADGRVNLAHAIGIALGLLTLAWVALRIPARRNRILHRLFSPGWPTFDQVLKYGLILVQLLIVAPPLYKGVFQEIDARNVAAFQIGPDWIPSAVDAFTTGAWLVLVILTVALLVSLWDRWTLADLVAAILLALSVPALIAGSCWSNLAVASALRWGLAITFVVASAAVWYRTPLSLAVRSLGARLRLGRHSSTLAQVLLILLMAAPVVLLTVLAAGSQVFGPGVGPKVGWLKDIGMTMSYLIPLVLVIGGLVGHAIRQQNSGYVFAAGMVAELAVFLGYPLVLKTSGIRFYEYHIVTWIECLSIMASVWALLWVAARRWYGWWLETADRPAGRVLMTLQLLVSYAGVAIVLVIGMALLFFDVGGVEPTLQAVASPVGWIAVILALGAGVVRGLQAGHRTSPHRVGLVGMVLLFLLACTVQVFAPEWGYRTWMLGWASYALLIVAATWWMASQRTQPGAEGPPQALLRLAAVWVRVAGVAAVLLGLKAAFFHHQEQLWAAAAISISGMAGATMAIWRRREGWAFAAALTVNIAASLVVWHFHLGDRMAHWWIVFVQANTIATAAVALVWLAVRRRLYLLRELSVRDCPLLSLQVTLAVVGNALLVLCYYGWMAFGSASWQHLLPLAKGPGWLALLMTAAAAIWYFKQYTPSNLFHAIGALAVGAVALASCAAMAPSGASPFLHVRVFVDGLAVAALVVLALGWFGHRLAASLVDRAAVEAWSALLAGLAVGYALPWCSSDPYSPWPLAAAIFAASVVAGLLAFWQQRGAYTYISGLLLNVAGTAVWLVQNGGVLTQLVSINVFWLAVGGIVWTLLDVFFRRQAPAPNIDGRRLPYSHSALNLATLAALAVAVVGVVVRCGWLPDARWPTLGLNVDWLAIAVLAAALAIALCDASARFVLSGLYLVALTALGHWLVMRGLSGATLCWTLALEWAALLLAAGVMAEILPRLRGLANVLRIPQGDARWPADWFATAQAVGTGAVAVIAAWVALDFQFDSTVYGLLNLHLGRLASPLAVALLVPAAVLTARSCKQSGTAMLRDAWQMTVLPLAGLAITVLGWAWLQADLPLAWLHRSVVLMVAAAVTTLAGTLASVRLLPVDSDWNAAIRKVLPWLGGLAGVMLVAVLGQEAYGYRLETGTPMAMWAVVTVTAVLAALAAACIAMAVMSGRDPLGLSPRGRQAYVYAAEVLLVLIGIHLRLTHPHLFALGIIRKYGMYLVMLVAFVGAGLSEFFRRRRLEVLAEPLENTARWLPILPMAMAFYFHQSTPLVWFLIGLFYSVLAVTRRSFWLGLAAVATGNMGLWVLWHNRGLDFLVHPQLWLIPLAMAALVAEYFSRRRLPAGQSTAIRYLSLSVIYISSSADMFIAGIGNNLILPAALLGLSLLGILLGMALQIRSFLYLGTSFLLLVVVTLVKYMSIDLHQTWVFWLCIVLLGAAIIALFAVFEKRRNDIRAAMQRFKSWQQ